MATNERWGRQLRAARRSYEDRHDVRLSYAEIGRRVGAQLNRAPFSATSARAWFVEGQEPETFQIAAAIARVLEADPGELAFGGDALGNTAGTFMVGPIPLDPSTIVDETDESRADYERMKAEEAAKQQPAKLVPKDRKSNGR
jgi:hypothetical protein